MTISSNMNKLWLIWHKVVHCPERESDEKMNDTNHNTKCLFTSKVTIDEEREQENEKVKLVFDSPS